MNKDIAETIVNQTNYSRLYQKKFEIDFRPVYMKMGDPR